MQNDPADGLFIGLMSGTSADAVDGVLCRFSPRPETLARHSIPIGDDFRERAFALLNSGADELERSAELDRELAELSADCTNALLGNAGVSPDRVTAIGSHGQTIRHQPDRGGGRTAFTVQVGDPNRLVELTGITTVADFRRRDMAAGGEGAPLAPAFHRAVFSRSGETVCVVNLGGIANITVLGSGGEVTGYDTGPANALMDSWIQRHHGERFDRDGIWAASGAVNPALLAALRADSYFSRSAPKSTGREYFNDAWLSHHLRSVSQECERIPAADVQATLLELTASTVADALPADATAVYLCGGGARNPALHQRLQALAGKIPVQSTAECGVDPGDVEPLAFAWLARQTLLGLPGNIPAVTGAAGERILGAIYPA